jgi:hypothetical protein|tara:strand:- start:25190 stop:25624 length:435 start_codon:yes stop_codon:yes gene_type:complete
VSRASSSARFRVVFVSSRARRAPHALHKSTSTPSSSIHPLRHIGVSCAHDYQSSSVPSSAIAPIDRPTSLPHGALPQRFVSPRLARSSARFFAVIPAAPSSRRVASRAQAFSKNHSSRAARVVVVVCRARVERARASRRASRPV